MDTCVVQVVETPSSSSSSSPCAIWSRLSSRRRRSSASSGEYTSLRDVLAEDVNGGGCTVDIHDFDTSNININDQLLKHAASVYLQSAVIDATPRHLGCLSRLRRWLRRRKDAYRKSVPSNTFDMDHGSK
ncbi:hypothetical protein E2562_018304 [Oryza meyeriana var. granulata]|uniref:Uncharacterized protein n=1 Tax=Oryza meyeriana var. granulata TaxID=110450 RepID=A0A6G1CRB0_9ORYZ|nr:hypothetical protein E2562_018304 [Oryza meyeriana var. granulata]